MPQALGILDTGPSRCGLLEKATLERGPSQDMLSHTGLNTARHIWNLRATQLGGQSARLASIPADVGVWARTAAQ